MANIVKSETEISRKEKWNILVEEISAAESSYRGLMAQVRKELEKKVFPALLQFKFQQGQSLQNLIEISDKKVEALVQQVAVESGVGRTTLYDALDFYRAVIEHHRGDIDKFMILVPPDNQTWKYVRDEMLSEHRPDKSSVVAESSPIKSLPPVSDKFTIHFNNFYSLYIAQSHYAKKISREELFEILRRWENFK